MITLMVTHFAQGYKGVVMRDGRWIAMTIRTYRDRNAAMIAAAVVKVRL